MTLPCSPSPLLKKFGDGKSQRYVPSCLFMRICRQKSWNQNLGTIVLSKFISRQAWHSCRIPSLLKISHQQQSYKFPSEIHSGYAVQTCPNSGITQCARDAVESAAYKYYVCILKEKQHPMIDDFDSTKILLSELKLRLTASIISLLSSCCWGGKVWASPFQVLWQAQ